MSKIVKTIFYLVLCAAGTALTVFSVFMIFQPFDWVIRGSLIVLAAFGIATTLVAVGLLRGARPRDVVRDLFTGLPGL